MLDLSGAEELCSEPAPLERIRRAWRDLSAGGSLEVRTPIAEHAFAARAWARKQGITVVSDERVDSEFRLVLAGPETAHPTT